MHCRRTSALSEVFSDERNERERNVIVRPVLSLALRAFLLILTMAYEGGNQRYVALDEFNRANAPGWEPYLHWYSFKQYKENLELWGKMVTEGEHKLTMAQMGPMIYSRLRGAAKRMALKMEIESA